MRYTIRHGNHYLFFLDRDQEQEFEFLTDKTGKITEIYFTNRGAKLEVEKL